MCFFPFGCIWDHYATAQTWCKTRQTGAINAKRSCHDVLIEIFTTNAPDPQHWNVNSCFCAFLSIWVHLEPFRYCTKLAAKCVKLVQLIQKFRPWCLVKSFATNAPDPHHWTLNSFFGAFISVWVHLEPFRYCTKLGANGPTWCN